MRVGFCLIAVLASLITAFSAARASEADWRTTADKPWSVDVRMKNYFNSHTSYEFGNPFPPNQAPLSRLEFPLNTLWVGIEARRRFPRFSAGIDVSRNISRETNGTFKDSDWEDESMPGALSIYSESSTRMEPSYIVRGDVDLKVSDWIGLPDRFDLRPVVGFRWQRFSLVSHDGIQYYPSSGGATPAEALPGDGIRFEQTYRHYFLGIRTIYDLGEALSVQRLKLLAQLDWAYVEGNNEDHHLLREGNRVTYEKTRGDAWHALVGLQYGLTKNLSAKLEADYLRIQTTGTHRLVNDLFNIDYSFDYGVKVWSKQTNVMLGLQYKF